MTVTIVTAYYKIKSKASPETYKEWFQNFFKLNIKVVCFTDEESLQYLNPPHNWHVVVQPVDEWKIQSHRSWFEQCKQYDFEKYHTVDLYMLWCNKPYFVQQAIKLNPFNSDIFAWVDIGSVRNSHTLACASNFPNKLPSLLEGNKCMFVSIEPHNFNLDKDKTFLTCFDLSLEQYYHRKSVVNWIQGTFFAVSKTSFTNFLSDYELCLNDHIEGKRFCGKDQIIFSTMAAKHPSYLKILNAVDVKDCPIQDKWFAFYSLCS